MSIPDSPTLQMRKKKKRYFGTRTEECTPRKFDGFAESAEGEMDETAVLLLGCVEEVHEEGLIQI